MGLYRVVLTSTRALAPLRFQFSGDIKRHALDGRAGFFLDFLFSLFLSPLSGVARIRVRALLKHTHTYTRARSTAGEKSDKGNKWRGSNESLSSNVGLQVFITRSLPAGSRFNSPFF